MAELMGVVHEADKTVTGFVVQLFQAFKGFITLRRLRSDLLNPKFGSQKSALL